MKYERFRYSHSFYSKLNIQMRFVAQNWFCKHKQKKRKFIIGDRNKMEPSIESILARVKTFLLFAFKISISSSKDSRNVNQCWVVQTKVPEMNVKKKIVKEINVSIFSGQEGNGKWYKKSFVVQILIFNWNKGTEQIKKYNMHKIF